MRNIIVTLVALAIFTPSALAQSKPEVETAIDSFNAGMDATVANITKMRDELCAKQDGQYAQAKCRIRFEHSINLAVLAKANVTAAYVAAVLGNQAVVTERNQKVVQGLDELRTTVAELAKDYDK